MRLLACILIGISFLTAQTTVWAQLRIIPSPDDQFGSPADDWPWMAAIIYTDRDSVENGQFCGATLVHPSWVLTAAHCTMGETVDSIEVVLGRSTLSDEESGEIIGIQRIIRHHDYDYHPDNPLADIALMELQKPSSQAVLKVAENYSLITRVNELATVMGWGRTDVKKKNSYSDILRQTDIPITSNTICNESYEGDVQDTMLCAGYQEGGTDACVGDSGGPLIIDSYAGPQQIGIVSWGEGCAEPDHYGVYTRLSSYQNFVTEHVCEAEAIPSAPQIEIKTEADQVTISWKTVKNASGYQFYWAPYSAPISSVTLDQINSFDLGNDTHLSISLETLNYFPDKLYVAIRAYQNNCYSDYSNLETFFVE